MSAVHLLLLILGIVLIVVGVARLIRWRAWVDGVILVVIGLIVLIAGGFLDV
jgi:uncharacterized membrane protein